MAIAMNMSDFLCGIGIFCEEIEIGIGYAQNMLKILPLPDELQDEIEDGIDECMLLKEQYEDIYLGNAMADDYEQKVADAGQTFQDDMSSFYIFLAGVDIGLMQFGDGPRFLSDGFLLPQCIEL